MGADDLFAVIYTLGVKEAGGVQAWEQTLEKWADEAEEAEKLANFMARRHDKTWRPKPEELPGQMRTELIGEPAPLKET